MIYVKNNVYFCTDNLVTKHLYLLIFLLTNLFINMMKRLLFSALSVLFAFSASAVQKGDYVYTPQGRFLITGDVNLMGTAGSFANLDGWSVVTAAAHELADNFAVGTEEGSGLGYAQSVVNTINEGMKYTNSSLDASTTYVISYKMRNAVEAAPTRPLTTSLATSNYVKDGANVVLITGTAGEDVVTYNQASETTTDWVTYCYAIKGDGKARELTINLNSMTTSLQIADIQILEAKQVADDRDAKAKADYILSIYNLTDWSQFDDETQNIFPAENLITAYGQVAKLTEDMYSYMIDVAEYDPAEIEAACPGFTEDLITYNNQVAKYNDQFNTFKTTQLTAYIDITKDGAEHLGYQGGYNQQKYTVLGTWNVVSPAARGYWRKGWPDLGHYAGSTNFTEAELSKEFTLFEGGYTFKADMVGYNIRSTSKDDWEANLGLVSDDGFVFVTNAEGEVIASSDTTGLERDINGDWTTKSVTFNIPADGKYTMHIKAIRRYETNGGQVHVRWPELYGKSFGKYTADQKLYIAAVQEQITAGDNAYQAALDNIASENYIWGKVTLQACVDTMTAKKTAYDAVFDDEEAIVNTYDKDTYEAGATNPNSQMVYEVYTEYVKDLLAANKTIKAVNDTLNMLPAKISDAEKLLTLSIYQISGGKAALESEIETAKQVDANMRATDYSVENAQAIKDEIAALEKAITECKNGIDPAKYTTVYADIDFSFTTKWDENITEYTEEGAAATIKGKVGSIEVPSFNKVTESGTSFPYELGIDADGGYKDYGDMLRVGGSDASVSFTASDLGKNVLLVSMDWYFSRLDNAYVGFEVLDEDGNRIAGVQPCEYNSTKVNYNTFEMNDRIGQFYAANNVDNKALIYDGNHTQWLAVLDFANAKQYLIATVPSGTVFSDPVDMNVTGTPATFKITATGFKNYPGRRSWFDNLKIQKLEINPSGGIKGDVNGDGEVDGTDIQEVINLILVEGYSKAADVNGDGEVDGTDIQEIINIILLS